MRRREFISLIGGATAWPLTARGQHAVGRVHRIGYLSLASRQQQLHLIQAFEDGLRRHGYRPGENVIIEYRFADVQRERLSALAAELVRLSVDVIVTGNTENTAAAMKATAIIPIVMLNSIDPIGAGIVASLGRPGGNVTGFAQDTGSELNGKRLELLKEVLPKLSRVGILFNPEFALNRSRVSSMLGVTRALGLTLVQVEARGLEALEQAFGTLVKEQAQALVVLAEPVLFNHRVQIGDMALTNRLPTISAVSEYAEAGLLLTYGPDLQDLFRRSAVFVDKIFRGVKPADLPVEQPTKFEVVVNLKTAKSLGIEVPPSLLMRADKVLE